jgi:WD40 repeat protein
VRGGLAAVATQRRDGGENVLGILDWEAFVQGGPCLRGAASLAYPPAQVAWLAEDVLLVGGSGAFTPYRIPPGQGQPRAGRALRGVHKDVVCGVAANPKNGSEFLSGSKDCTVRLVDVERGPLKQREYGGPVSSVHWPLCNQGVCPSWTLDSGTFYVYDNRQPWVGSAYLAQTGRPGLRSHCRYNDFNAVLGFEDGGLMHLDLRTGGAGALLGQIRDPKAGAVRQLVYDLSTDCLLVGGADDFSLWRHHDGSTVPAGHGMPGSSRRVTAQPSGTGVAFVSEGRFLVTTTTGQLAAYQVLPESKDAPKAAPPPDQP